MKSDIILSGVGGQGILSIAAFVAMATLETDLGKQHFLFIFEL